ncbi:MAG: histidinol dehydrogenase [Oscillospiraceae bacterium]|nr:histidinol dehydrogenase [Oscillospiraceae bacterium]
MIRIIKADGTAEYEFLKEVENRNGETDKKISAIVSDIIDNVKARGDEAIDEYTLKFDGKLPPFREVPREVINDAMTDLSERSPELVQAMLSAMENISDFHNRQKEQSFIDTRADGCIVGQRVRGLDRVGLYVPGGSAPLFSTVLMNAVPAKIAGVRELIMCTPPGKDGKPAPEILCAAAMAGVDRVFAVGGAQAIAAMACGTETMPRVDKIVGPGNIFVATAKKLLYGRVDIDMVAGPSEILVVADDKAEPKFLAADLMSQAEHDKMASAILITTDERIARETAEQIETQMERLERRDIIRASIDSFGAVIVAQDLTQAFELANSLAPEHLELAVEDPLQYIGMIDNAGSVFLGRWSSEPLGDYYAGPNHVLPTGGTARFFSPLSVASFTKRSQFIYYTETALREAKDDIITLADSEGLTAHANAIAVRFEGE